MTGPAAPSAIDAVALRQAEEMCRLGASAFARGLTPGSSGNLSARLPDGGFLMTPTNACLGFLDPARLSCLDDAGRPIAGDPPTKEAFLHLAMYRGRPALGGVTHLHSTYAVCLSCLPAAPGEEDALLPYTPYVRIRLGRVLRVPYATPGDPSLGPAIEAAAQRAAGLLIANHGPVAGGATFRDSLFAAEELEEAAKVQLLLAGRGAATLPPAALDGLDRIALLPR